MHVLHRDLEAVEATRLRHLYLLAEPLDQVLVHDAVRSGEEGQHVRDKVLLTRLELLPVAQVLRQIDLLDRPERGFGLAKTENKTSYIKPKAKRTLVKPLPSCTSAKCRGTESGR